MTTSGRPKHAEPQRAFDLAAIAITPCAETDIEFLGRMLYEAVCWRPDGPRPPIEGLLRSPELSKWLTGLVRGRATSA